MPSSFEKKPNADVDGGNIYDDFENLGGAADSSKPERKSMGFFDVWRKGDSKLKRTSSGGDPEIEKKMKAKSK